MTAFASEAIKFFGTDLLKKLIVVYSFDNNSLRYYQSGLRDSAYNIDVDVVEGLMEDLSLYFAKLNV